MAISAVVGAVAVGGAVVANKANHAAQDAAGDQVRQAKEAQAQQAAQAEAERAQTDRIAAEQATFEQQRQEAAAAQQAASLAQQQQIATDGALGAQNQQTSNLTPTVQLAAQGDGAASATNARKRRAEFRPEYQSGVTI